MSASHACLTCGYRLSRRGSALCPECGRAFDSTDSSTVSVRLEHPELLLELRQEWIAEALRAELRDRGVLSQLERRSTGFLGTGLVQAVRLFVDRDDLAAARGFIESRRIEHVTASGERARRCRACGEDSPAAFDVCWSCGAPLDGRGEATAPPQARREGLAASYPSGAPSDPAHAPHPAQSRWRPLLVGAGFLIVVTVIAALRGEPWAAGVSLLLAVVLAAWGLTIALSGRPR
jgi:hypothetical protein